MKLKFTLLTMALSSLSALAAEPQTIVLPDGSSANVLMQKGSSTTYVKEAKAGADGKVHLVPGQVFDGELLVRKSDGQCLAILEHLVSLKSVSVGEFKVQVPVTTRESKAVSCTS